MDLTIKSTEILRDKMPEVQRDCQSQVTKLIDKLFSWRDESHRQMSEILDYHRKGIDESFNNMFEEFSHLQGQVSTLREERGKLLMSVDNLNQDIQKLSAKVLNTHAEQNSVVLGSSSPTVREEPLEMLKVHKKVKNKENSRGKGDMMDRCSEPQKKVYPKDIKNEVSQSIPIDKMDLETGHKNSEANNEQKIDTQSASELKKAWTNNQLVDPTSINTITENIEECIEEGYGLYHFAEQMSETQQNNSSEIGVSNVETNHGTQEENMDPTLKVLSRSKLQDSDKGTEHKKSHNKKAGLGKGTEAKCEQCQFKTVWKTALNRHIRTVHNKIRNHKCGLCGFSFAQKSTLQHHVEAVHKKLRKHVCEECGYSATQKSNIRTHMKRAHSFGSKQSEQMLHCGYCEYFTRGEKNFRRHMASIHKIK